MKRIKTYKVFESAESVESICKKYGISNWKLNPDGTVDVDGDVDLYNKKLDKLPLKFGRVTGSFNCSVNKITSLEGSPNFVDGHFNCCDNELTSLEGCPEKIFESLWCNHNNIITLEFYPTILAGQLFTYNNPIHEIWKNVRDNKGNNHGVLLELFWLNNPIRFENGEWVCYREFLDNFFEEIDVPSPPKLKNYKEV